MTDHMIETCLKSHGRMRLILQLGPTVFVIMGSDEPFVVKPTEMNWVLAVLVIVIV